MHPLPCLNPHRSFPIAHSVPALTLLISLPNSLPTTLNKLMSLELLHSYLSPCPLYRGTIQAPRQFVGITPILKLKFNSLTSHSNTAIPPFFKHSTGNPSSPGALSDFIYFILLCIYNVLFQDDEFCMVSGAFHFRAIIYTIFMYILLDACTSFSQIPR